MPTEKPRVTFTISQERLSEVEAYRFDNKIKNQTQAILSLIDKGLSGFSEHEEKAPSLSDEALKLAEDYDSLDGHGKRIVRLVADEEKSRCKTECKEQDAAALRESRGQMEAAEEIAPPIPLHQPYTQVAAAEGAGAFLLDDGYEEVLVEMNKYTKQADVILKVVGRSMEPEIPDGSRVLVRVQPSINIGEIGVFILDGQGYLKERASDRLVSLNPAIEDVYIGGLQQVECYGKFIKVLDPDWVK